MGKGQREEEDSEDGAAPRRYADAIFPRLLGTKAWAHLYTVTFAPSDSLCAQPNEPKDGAYVDANQRNQPYEDFELQTELTE